MHPIPQIGIPVFLLLYFIMAKKKWNKHRHQSIEACIVRMWHLYKILFYAATNKHDLFWEVNGSEKYYVK